jgi:hypothetical protein
VPLGRARRARFLRLRHAQRMAWPWHAVNTVNPTHQRFAAQLVADGSEPLGRWPSAERGAPDSG